MPKTMSKSVVEKVRRNPLVFPTAQDIERIANNLKLDDAQTSALRTAVGSISGFAEQILDHGAKSLPYAERLRRTKRIEKALRRLRDEVKRNEHLLADIVPKDVGQVLFRSLTFTAMSKALGEDRFPEEHRLRRVIDKAASESRLTVKALEADLRLRYRALGSEHGHVMFRAIINNLHEPFRIWVTSQSANRGGLRPKWVRALVLDQLIKSSNAIIGKRATSTHDGKFADLCRAVLPAFGQPIRGVVKAIPGALKRRKASNG